MSNQNKTYTNITDVKPFINKTTNEDSVTLKSIFNNVMRIIRTKHL